MVVLKLYVDGVATSTLSQGNLDDATFKNLALKLADGCKANFGCRIDSDESGFPTHLHFKSKYDLAGAESLWSYLTKGH